MEIMCDILDKVARKGLAEKMTFESSLQKVMKQTMWIS